MPLSRAQLESSLDDVFFLAQQLFAYYSWMTRVQPLVGSISATPHFTIVQNAVVEAQLMSYRKLNEFFMPTNPRLPDDLKSELFGYAATGGFMRPQEIEEFHKRVAHPTTRKATDGNVSFEIYQFSHAALEHVLPFLAFASVSFLSVDSERGHFLHVGSDFLRGLWIEWTNAVEPAKQIELKA